MTQAARWIVPELARLRAGSIRDLRYVLELEIDAHARTLRGTQRIDLVRDECGGDLILDWRPQDGKSAIAAIRSTLRTNGTHPARGAIRLRDGHLVVRADELRAGPNRIEAAWTAPILDAGGAITRYRDPDDGALYVYTLFVPADASTVFPCFDQPDLKAAFELSLAVPAAWRAVANAPLADDRRTGRRRLLRFAPTEPISTYQFAFAAGPFVTHRSPGVAGALWVRRSQSRRAARHCDAILQLNARAVSAFAAYFAHPFPFAKYDLVAIPELPYRGMEHAGATFLAEKDLFPLPPVTRVAQFERAQLIFHETAHQWAGDLVTMQSFDDLWLKEGFANFMGYKLAARVLPRELAEVAFHLLKTQAYATDESGAATPLHHSLPDLAAAKSAYGSIVYAKAPALLRQMEFLLGAQRFRAGVRRWVKRHAYGASTWRELIAALEEASGQSLARWAAAWILRPGVPRVRASIRRLPVRGTRLTITQLPAGAGEQEVWPLRMLAELHGERRRIARSIVDMTSRRTELAFRVPATAVRHAALNCGDHAYAIVDCATASVTHMTEILQRSRSGLERIQLWQALWHSVHAARLDPARFVWAALETLERERNPMVLGAVLQNAGTALDRLGVAERQPELAARFEALCLARRSGPDADRAAAWLAAFIATARTPAGLDALEALVTQPRMPGRPVSAETRRHAAKMLVVRGAWEPAEALRALAPARAERSALELEAAQPMRKAKRRAFARMLRDETLSDEAVLAALGCLNHPAHAALSAPLLGPALRALPALYRRRKIFFVNRWIAAFAAGQSSAAALRLLRGAIRSPEVDESIRRKLREAEYDLARVVAIRGRWRRLSD